MFGFNLEKLLFTAIVIYVVWQGFKLFGRMQARERETARQRMREEMNTQRMRNAAGAKPAAGQPGVEDMVECRTCGAYVAQNGARNCGRKDCPYPG